MSVAGPVTGIMSGEPADRGSRPDRWLRERRKGCEILVTYRDGSTRKILRSRGWSEWLRRRLELETAGFASAELIREVPRDEFLRHRSGRRHPAPGEPADFDRSPYPASEIRVIKDGVASTRVVRQYWCPSTERILLRQKGVESAELIRRLSGEEYRARRAAGGRGEGDAAPPDAAPPGPREPAAPARPREPFAWEVLIRRSGRTQVVRVVARTEESALRLMAELEGVDAAAVIRPLTLEQYRECLE